MIRWFADQRAHLLDGAGWFLVWGGLDWLFGTQTELLRAGLFLFVLAFIAAFTHAWLASAEGER